MLNETQAAIPHLAKQIRYVSGYGEIVAIHDVTEIFEANLRKTGDGMGFLHEWALANYPDAATSYELQIFEGGEERWEIATRHNRVQEKLAVDAAEAARKRRYARMMQGRDW